MSPRAKRRVAPAEVEQKAPVKVRGVMERMRRRQKWFLVILTSALLVPFGAYGLLNQLTGGPRGPAKGTAYGRTVSETAFRELARRMVLAEAIAQRHFVQSDLARWLFGGQSPEVAWHQLRSILRPESPSRDDETWDRYVWLHEAGVMGLQVSDVEIDDTLALFFANREGRFDRSALEAFIKNWRSWYTDEGEVRQAVADELLVGGVLMAYRGFLFQFGRPASDDARFRESPKLFRALLATVDVSDDEVWAYYLSVRREYTVSYAAIQAQDFLDRVPAPTEDDLKAWYERFKEVTPEESDDGVGYHLPQRCRLQYFAASADDFTKDITVTDAELRQEYERTKTQYPFEDEGDTPATTRPTTGPATQQATQPATRPTTAPATQPTTGPASRPEYKPFEEVRDQVCDDLVKRKAREAALRAIVRAGTQRIRLESDQADETGPPPDLDYRAMARLHNLRYVPPTDLLTAHQAGELPDLKDARDLQAGKSVQQTFFGPTTYDWADMSDLTGEHLYHVWRTDFIQARRREFAEARPDVERDLRIARAYEMAYDRARTLVKDLEALKADTDPVAILAAQHEVLTAGAVGPFTLAAAETAPRRLPQDADPNTRERVLEGLFARAISERGLQPGQSAVVGDPRTRVVYLFRIASETAPGVDDFRLMPATYRQQALAETRNRLMKAWREAVKKRADVQPAKVGPEAPERRASEPLPFDDF